MLYIDTTGSWSLGAWPISGDAQHLDRARWSLVALSLDDSTEPTTPTHARLEGGDAPLREELVLAPRAAPSESVLLGERSLRGSTAIRGSCDEELLIRRASDANDAAITIERGKSRRGDVRGLSYRLADRRGRDGRIAAIVPELAGAPAEDDGDAAADADESPRARMRARLAPPGLTATDLKRAMGGRAENVKPLRDPHVAISSQPLGRTCAHP